MTPKRTVTVDADVLARYEQLAQETGESVDDLANEAMKRELARRWLQRIGREGQFRRSDMTDDEVDAMVNEAIQQDRAAQRGR